MYFTPNMIHFIAFSIFSTKIPVIILLLLQSLTISSTFSANLGLSISPGIPRDLDDIADRYGVSRGFLKFRYEIWECRMPGRR